MRVLLVGKGPPDRGGISAFLQTLLASELASAYDLQLLNLSRDVVPQGGRFSSANITRTMSDAREVYRASGDAEIVHIHSALAPGVTLVRAAALAAAARARGARTIVHAHSGRVQAWLVTPRRRLLAGNVLRVADRVLAVSEAGRATLAGVLGERVELVDNGIDIGVFGRPQDPPPATHDPPRVLYAGVLTPRKGILDLVEASAILHDRGVRHELLVAGGTPDEGPSAEAEVRARAGERVRFLGALPRSAMPAAYRDADIFCLPSWSEAMPLSVLEASASGLPVVATDVGDVRRAVVSGRTGTIVAPRRPDALADALEPLLRDAGLRRRFGGEGAEYVREHFDMARTTAHISRLYEDLISE